ncbi:MAG: serine--tRNA ligase, partial [Clostridia bacterium]|nr:serine--tRNA ligase [Clostridia bacterium]
MLDLKRIRTDADGVKAAIKKREMDLDSVVDEILAIDEKRRALTGEVEAMKAQQNAVSKKIPQIKK